jgi:predicted glutamine amidotransferase
MQYAKQLLDYLGTQEEAVLTFNASNMVLAVHSNASYLSKPKARSKASRHFFLSDDTVILANNGAIINIAHIGKHVMSLATEAELAALYIMAREAVYIRIILKEMGHKQPPTPMQTNNAMADAVINGKVQPKHTKAMDMQFHWLQDRECQKQFRIYC